MPVLVMLGLALGSWRIGRPWSPAGALVAFDVETTNSSSGLRISEVGYFGFDELGAQGSRPIHVLSVEILGVPDGMKVEGLYFYRSREGGRPMGPSERIRPFLRPVDSVVFDPPSEERRWVLIAGVYATAPGSYKTKGLRVCYEVDGRRGCESYRYNLEIGTKTTAADSKEPPSQ